MERQRGFFFLAGLALTFALVSGCSSSKGTAQPTGSGTANAATGRPANSATAVSTAPEDALRLYVQRRLTQGFVADCAKAKRPDDVGKQCAAKLGERSGLVAYKLGPTFASYTRIMILEQQNGVWTIARQQSRNPGQPDIPGVPWPLKVGAEVVVVGTAPDCLKVRAQPTITANPLDCVHDGTKVKVVAGPVDADDIEWWQLEGKGWAAADYLRFPDDTSIQLTPTPSS